MMTPKLLVTVLLTLPLTQDGWMRAAPDFEWDFPRDHWAHHDYRTEWWYQTGQLQDANDPDHRFGYQFTFFRVGILPNTPALESNWAANAVIMGHASVVDFRSGDHVFTEVVYRGSELLGGFQAPGDTLVAWSRGPGGNDQPWTLRWNGSAYDVAAANRWAGVGFDLTSTPDKPMIFQGPNGFSAKNASGTAASMYYSFTRLETSGTLTVGGQQYDVTGTSWMDKEFGSDQIDRNQVGWDWFSLQFNDGTEAMVYILRNATGVDYAHLTTVDESGRATHHAGDQVSLTVQRTWTSPETTATYPAEWQLEVDGRSLLVRPVVDDQENISALIPGLYYWEGAVEILEGGALAGRGYVELTGYGDSSLPALSGN